MLIKHDRVVQLKCLKYPLQDTATAHLQTTQFTTLDENPNNNIKKRTITKAPFTMELFSNM